MTSYGRDNYGFSYEGGSGVVEEDTPSPAYKKRWSCCRVTLLMLGVLSASLGTAMLSGGYNAMFNAILKSQMEIQPGSTSYDIWHYTPVPLYLRFYFYNFTNPDEFSKGGKAVLDEVGPYCYREYHEKQNLTFHPNNTVTFFQQRWWLWDQGCSGNLSLDDIITSLNTVPISAAWSVRNKPLMLTGLNSILVSQKENSSPEPQYMRRFSMDTSVYVCVCLCLSQDPLLDWMQNNIVNITNISNILPPGLTNYDKFGWFYNRNLSLTYDGLFNMFTGEDTLDHVGLIDLWDNGRNTTFFDYPCNKVTGSAGEIWPPGLKKDFIEFYSSDLCMSVKLFYKGEVTDVNGLPGYRYWGTNYTFANGSVVEGNECYCVKGTCAPTGLLNAESCRMGSPAFISFPHFYAADPFLLDGVTGVSPPEADKHAFTMDLIPELGTPMWVSARMQINMYVRPYPGKFKLGKITILKDVPKVYLPLLWFEEVAGVPEDMASQLSLLLFIMKTPTMTIIFSIMLALGVLTILLAIFARC
ncbi:protein peste-like [Homarus americanus]|uniref:protein peste-like n=1 Tax=Homarus americanus TaxID=6706 RepID=UPI001C48FF10|nr:protein peste-like [Homarus americanus]